MSENTQPLDIVHDADNQVFTTVVEGQQCVLEYRLHDNVMTITHTGVPSAVGGRGVAGAMTKAAVQVAESKRWKVSPACSYAKTWFERHRDAAHLLA